MKKAIPLLLCLSVLLCGCVTDLPAPSGTFESTGATSATEETSAASQPTVVLDGDQFSDRDFETGADGKTAAITLKGDTAESGSNAVKIQGSTVTITDEGTYVISGTLNDGMIVVNTEKDLKTQLILDGANIHSETSAPIYILQSDKVFITLADGSENTLSNGGSYTTIDENNIDSVIFSKEDLTLNGSGSLTITSPAGHGIVSKDELTVTGGSYTIHCASHGLSGKDNICIAGGNFAITSGKDGMQADNDEDATLGYVYISGGSFDIRAEGDGISASGAMQLDGGTYHIVTGGGSKNAQKQASDNWGGFMGGGMGGGRGDRPRSTASVVTTSDFTTTSDDSTSIKAIKAGGDLTVNGGSFTMDCADDAVHANASVYIGGGNFEIATGDDGFHADESLTITDGSIYITESYEGLEGLHITVSGGDIKLRSSDDGLNAAGGTDSSGFGGRGNDMFGGFGMGGASSNGSILISGGTLYVNASGDGIDANGTLEITGGHTTVCGPTTGDTATLDYDKSGVISGGTFIGTGASGMAQTFSDSQQGVFAVTVGSQTASTEITLTDPEGNVILTAAPELNFGLVILSSPEIKKGQAYTITVGQTSGTFEAY